MEKIAVLKAIRALDRTEIACLVLDATEGATEQDARVADLCRAAGCGLVLLLNKADLVKGGEAQWKKIEEGVRERLRFVDYAPLVRVSARSGRNVGRITETVLRIHTEWRKRLSTALLNRFLEEAVGRHHPSAFRGREVKLYYVTQPQAKPPVFVFSTNRSEGVQEAYKRYLANQLREAFGFEGAPLRLFFRDRGKKKD
jgi:GTP-binding protein